MKKGKRERWLFTFREEGRDCFGVEFRVGVESADLLDPVSQVKFSVQLN